MSVLKFTAFGGEVPRKTKRSLPDNAAQVAENLLADTLEFRPLNTDSTATTITGPAANDVVKTLYRYPTTSSTIIGTTLSLSLVKSTIVDDQYDRVYASVMLGEAEYPPQVLSGGVAFPNASLRPLGVVYPTKAPVLTRATVDDAFMTPSEVTGFTESVMTRIRTIVGTALEQVLWNPSFSLSGNAAFREDPNNTNKGVNQRIWTNQTPLSSTPTWNTYNGTPIANHLWTTSITNPAWVTEGSYRTYYANFQAKVRTWRVKADVSAQTAQLVALVIPNTTDRVLSDAEITTLWAALRLQLPDDPLTTASTDLATLLTRYRTEYTTLVNYLDQGFTGDVTPQAGYQLVAQAHAALQASVDGITTFYDTLASSGFDNALLGYFKEVRFTGNIPEGETELVEDRYYTYTFVNDRGEESKPYLPGDGNSDTELPLLSCNQAQTAQIALPSGFNSGITAVDHITHWRVYRSAAGAQAASFMFVAEVPIGVTTFTDLRRTDSLSESMITTTWFPPPVLSGKCLKHLVQMPGGFLAGFVGNTVYFSEVNHPYAWPVVYAIPCNDDVVALGVFGVTLVVLTKGGPVYMTGSGPESMTKVEIESNEVCQSPRSVVPVSGGVLFASQNGLCVASQQGVQLMTGALWTQKEWQALSPPDVIAEELDGTVYMTHTGGLVMAALHIPTGKLVRMNTSVTAFYSDFSTGELFAALPPASGQVAKYTKLLAGSGLRTGRWRSKRIVLEKEAGFAWLVVEGEQSVSQPLKVDIYCYQLVDGVETITLLNTATGDGSFSAVVTDTQPMRVSVGRYKDFEVEIQGTCRVDSVLLTSSLVELQGVN